nr:MAG TPA: hypothetical protein [Caudoviricetes sp.]
MHISSSVKLPFTEGVIADGRRLEKNKSIKKSMV